MTFTNITKKTSPTVDFWELNPQIQYISPFNKLKDKFEDSSQHMWAIFFMSDPDEDVNRFYRYDIEKRKKNIHNFYPNIKWKNPLFNECLDAYPVECMTAIKRSLKELMDSLVQRRNFLINTPYTLDTIAKLDGAHAKTGKIYDELEKTIAKFTKQKEEDVRVYGGRKESFSERKMI